MLLDIRLVLLALWTACLATPMTIKFERERLHWEYLVITFSKVGIHFGGIRSSYHRLTYITIVYYFDFGGQVLYEE